LRSGLAQGRRGFKEDADDYSLASQMQEIDKRGHETDILEGSSS